MKKLMKGETLLPDLVSMSMGPYIFDPMQILQKLMKIYFKEVVEAAILVSQIPYGKVENNCSK